MTGIEGKVRGACGTDAPDIGRIYCEAWKQAYRGIVNADFLEGLTPENSAPPAERINPETCFVYEADVNAVALVNFGPGRDADREGEIRTIYALPEYWRQGIGTQLFVSAVKALKAAGYKKVYLWTLEANARARRFYERMGMILTGTRKITIADSELNEVRYEMNI